MRLFWPTVEMLVDAPQWVPPLGLRLDARWFPCLGAFPQGARRIDSDRLDLGPGLARGVVFQQGPGEPELCVFAFEGGCLEADLTIEGSRPVALLFRGSVRLGGAIDARRAGARRSGPGLAAAPGGGGGFGGRGGAAGGGAPGGGGGPSYGLAAACEVGSGGAPGSASGGLGGGGLQLGATGRLELAGAWIDVSGDAGAPARRGTAGGGGSGGSLVLHGREVRLDGATALSVRGGAGGAAGPGGFGGGGGGGGYVLGLCDGAGRFDPRGALFETDGGAGGSGRCETAGAGESGRPMSFEKNSGEDGARGVVFLAGKRDRGANRSRDARAAEGLGSRPRGHWLAPSWSGETTSRDPDHPARTRSPR